MGLLKSSRSRRLHRPNSFGGIPSRLLAFRPSPAPPQIITSTPDPSTSEPPSHHSNGSHYPFQDQPHHHLALNIPSNPEYPSNLESLKLADSPDHDQPPLQHLLPNRDPQEDSHLLSVQPATHHDDRSGRIARKAASHSDLHSTSHPSGSLGPAGLFPGSSLSRAYSPGPSMHSGVPPSSFKDLAVLYQVVAERRTAFDNLLWQVPATSLTAHAFLFSISLAADTGRFARIASMGLCIVITVLTLHLFTRQLQAEDADHRWLADFEERHQIEYPDRAHGDRWREYRAQKPRGAGRLGWLAMHRSYPLWSKGMLIIGFLAVAILILAIFDPQALLGYNCDLR